MSSSDDDRSAEKVFVTADPKIHDKEPMYAGSDSMEGLASDINNEKKDDRSIIDIESGHRVTHEETPRMGPLARIKSRMKPST
ncbi:hypothetical protein DIURU_000453 [Diutina rugosa]|uniref:Uncharacterized protein n=1 Tax=Diutina rugosa TaxID=5481 RepID=A0A642V348_DIURU|nr:uncharacterized protein DIURU_000453 [Diutina rugosa]KAA8907766.1 hypothetical protein DIURU_000453 [Diutina rugosa]